MHNWALTKLQKESNEAQPFQQVMLQQVDIHGQKPSKQTKPQPKPQSTHTNQMYHRPKYKM